MVRLQELCGPVWCAWWPKVLRIGWTRSSVARSPPAEASWAPGRGGAGQIEPFWAEPLQHGGITGHDRLQLGTPGQDREQYVDGNGFPGRADRPDFRLQLIAEVVDADVQRSPDAGPAACQSLPHLRARCGLSPHYPLRARCWWTSGKLRQGERRGGAGGETRPAAITRPVSIFRVCPRPPWSLSRSSGLGQGLRYSVVLTRKGLARAGIGGVAPIGPGVRIELASFITHVELVPKPGSRLQRAGAEGATVPTGGAAPSAGWCFALSAMLAARRDPAFELGCTRPGRLHALSKPAGAEFASRASRLRASAVQISGGRPGTPVC